MLADQFLEAAAGARNSTTLAEIARLLYLIFDSWSIRAKRKVLI